MALEDFTTYTEVDPNNHITVTANQLTSNVYENESAYVYKDYTAGHFNNFVHTLEITRTWNNGIRRLYPWLLANTVKDVKAMEDAGDNGIAVYWIYNAAFDHEIRLAELGVGSDTYNVTFADASNPYYLTIEKIGTSLTCKIYSDSIRTNLLDTLSLSVTDRGYRYMYGINSYNTGTNEGVTLRTTRLNLHEDPLDLTGIGNLQFTGGNRQLKFMKV